VNRAVCMNCYFNRGNFIANAPALLLLCADQSNLLLTGLKCVYFYHVSFSQKAAMCLPHIGVGYTAIDCGSHEIGSLIA